ncbi:hypothetical protein GCM10007390_38260 [Persicitalea jodogahamensis]|uniref:Uncharacterized protein n=1 Tax=Persicitalea jodogahamensis TaxID=402147 RepID=A0A8J3GBV1_9BACT|nr:hypothetical protein GCM10007390_38260 [Persicitalea jodogahamensis]
MFPLNPVKVPATFTPNIFAVKAVRAAVGVQDCANENDEKAMAPNKKNMRMIWVEFCLVFLSTKQVLPQVALAY